MLGAGTIINPIIKIVTTVAVLAGVYFFIVEPILDTTEEVTRQASEAASNISEDVNSDVESSLEAAQLNAAVSRTRSYVSSLSSQWPAAAREVRACLHDAAKVASEVEHCASYGERLVHRVQSNRNFSLSYADSLRAQGDSAAAQQVEQCVKDAGFETAAMRRCRNLADELLFG